MAAPAEVDLADPAALAAACRHRWLTSKEVCWLLTNCNERASLQSIIKTTELDAAPRAGAFVLYDLSEDLRRPIADFSAAKRINMKKKKRSLKSRFVLFKRDGVLWEMNPGGGLAVQRRQFEIDGMKRLGMSTYNSANGELRKKVYHLINSDNDSSTPLAPYYFVQYLSGEKFKKTGRIGVGVSVDSLCAVSGSTRGNDDNDNNDNIYNSNNNSGSNNNDVDDDDDDDDDENDHMFAFARKKDMHHRCFADEVVEAAKKVGSSAEELPVACDDNNMFADTPLEYTCKQLVQHFGQLADIERGQGGRILLGDEGVLRLSRYTEQSLWHASLLADSLQAADRRSAGTSAGGVSRKIDYKMSKVALQKGASSGEQGPKHKRKRAGFADGSSSQAQGRVEGWGPAEPLVRFVQLKMSLLLRAMPKMRRRLLEEQFDASAATAIAAVLESAL